ncbi:hypothetical protein AAC03nite_15910 [Alicyclobacillus acidoterrestris]|uniref:YqhG family protein n=1 Tax=Alicyclobacillus suci TaxID=2816080 RepID=UPI001194E439|nr:YqhG family protein [Alicyclobacillus suci]GEO25806.1 hypothetical protein AAC03nite_15910 [Alicyclobacillus acidoterrestris]
MQHHVPLREESERLSFCEAYFDSVGAETIYRADGYREVRLPIDVDKELTDRPFYWLWVEKTNQKVEPTTLRLSFTKAAKAREDARLAKAYQAYLEEHPPQNPYERMFAKPPTTELITLGCFRLNKIVDSARRRGQFACVQPAHATARDQLVPWLVLNLLVQFVTDSVEETWLSVGICLANHQHVFGFYEKVKAIDMTAANPARILENARMSLPEAFAFAKSCVSDHIATLPDDWADEAKRRLTDDLSQLDTYYKSILPDYDEDTQQELLREHQRKRANLIKKSAPRTEVHITQVALVGLPIRHT